MDSTWSAPNGDERAIESHGGAKARHHDQDRDLRDPLHGDGAEIALHPGANSSPVRLAFLQFETDDDVNRRQGSKTLDGHQRDQSERRGNPTGQSNDV